jgi:hypothetical protein
LHNKKTYHVGGDIMSLREAIHNESKWTKTWNGADTLATTDSACLDMFGRAGAMRGCDTNEKEIVFSRAFREDKDITSVTIPEGILYIGGESAFQDCFNLKNVVMPETALYIGRYTFKGCIGLTSITIPKLSYVYSGAFEYCNNLRSVTFKNTPESISSNAFNGCVRLKDIYVPWSKHKVSNAPWGATNATIHYDSEV